MGYPYKLAESYGDARRPLRSHLRIVKGTSWETSYGAVKQL